MARGDDLVLKISADTSAIAAGLRPMETALSGLSDDARSAEDELKRLDDLTVKPDVDGTELASLTEEAKQAEAALEAVSDTDVEVTVRDEALRRARDDIERLRDEIAQNVIMGVDTRAAIREMGNLQTAVKRLSEEKHVVTIDVEPEGVIKDTASGMEGLREGARETAGSLGELNSGFT